VKALVTGATGLLGAHIVRALVEEGHSVRALTRASSDLSGLEGLPFERVIGDVLDAESLCRAANGCEVLFHAATSFTYWGERLDDLEATAVEGTRHALDAAAAAGLRKVVLTSSSVVFGYRDEPAVLDESAAISEDDGQPPYVVAKVRQDLAALEHARLRRLDLCIACPTMAVGPFSPTLGPSNAVILTYLADPFRLTYPGGCNIVSACDVGRGHVLLASVGRPGERYILGGENLEWEDVHRIVADLCGVEPPSVTAGHAALYIAAAAEELRAQISGRPPLTTRTQASMIGRYYWYSSAKARRAGYVARPPRNAIAEAVAWLVASRHVWRELRTRIHLHRDVYDERRALRSREASLRTDLVERTFEM
jgi:dihydroflavonol-4-reductase